MVENETCIKQDTLNGWHRVSDRLPMHNRPVAIAPSFNGSKFARYNDYDKCWDTEDGDDALCVLDAVKYWFEIPEAPKE